MIFYKYINTPNKKEFVCLENLETHKNTKTFQNKGNGLHKYVQIKGKGSSGISEWISK